LLAHYCLTTRLVTGTSELPSCDDFAGFAGLFVHRHVLCTSKPMLLVVAGGGSSSLATGSICAVESKSAVKPPMLQYSS